VTRRIRFNAFDMNCVAHQSPGLWRHPADQGPSPQRTPVIYQAGASPRGVRFAAENAEAIFIAGPSKRVLAQTVARIRDALEAAGRARDAARVYALATIITDVTDEAARRKHEEYLSYASVEGGLVFMSGWMGIDLSRYDLDDPIGQVESNAIQSAVAAFQEFDDDGREWTVRDIGKWAGIGGMGPVFVGSGETVADLLQEWAAETDLDGFNLAYAITPGSFEDIVQHVVPALTARGAYTEEYVPGSLRNALFGAGDRLPVEHRGASYRLGGAGSTALPDEISRAGATAETHS
jgi:alkanesulfonate monooxygenase SsuD/methylene tetrahydromethanopterin reductase-like flavin-dependent oxidoreductase (luciferase family)